MELQSSPQTISKASKAYIKDYYTSDTPTHGILRPTESFNQLLTLMEDSTFNAEVNMLADSVLKNGYKIVKEDDPTVRDIEKEKKFKKQYRSHRLLKQVLLNTAVLRNCFLEYTKDDELFTLETTEMYINSDPHGEILGYTQIHQSGPYAPKQFVYFTPEECIHIAPSRISTNPWGYVDTKSILDIVKAKQYLEWYMHWLFTENKFRDYWAITKPTSPEQVKGFIEALKQGKLNPQKDIVVEGEIEQKQLRTMADYQYMLQLYNQYKVQIREFLKVPPLVSGDVGDSGRSNGEFQVRFAFDNTVKSWQQLLEDEFTFEVFPLLGWEGFKLMIMPIDKPSEKDAIAMAVQLKGLGYNDDTINKFLIMKGVELPHDAKIKTPEEIAKEQETMMKSQSKIIGQSLQNMNAPSRQPRDKSKMQQKTQDKKETRPDQVIGKANPSTVADYNSYPYVY